MRKWNGKSPEERAERRKKLLALLGKYLDDLFLISGCACFTAAAALRWGVVGGLAVGGGCLISLSVLTARAGRR